MQAKPFLFRFRFVLFLLIYAIGFTAPWNRVPRLWHPLDTHSNTWSWLMTLTSTHAHINFRAAATIYLGLAIALTFAAAFLRTWAAAYIGAGIVHSGGMHGAEVVASGPYRFVRNPLYIGVTLHTLALTLLTPPTGALFILVMTTLLQLWLIFGEENFLTAQLGQPYLDYKARVPRLIPALTPRIPADTAKPAWGIAALGEIYFWGVVVTFILFGQQFNALPLERGLLISLGLSLVVRALLPQPKPSDAPSV